MYYRWWTIPARLMLTAHVASTKFQGACWQIVTRPTTTLNARTPVAMPTAKRQKKSAASQPKNSKPPSTAAAAPVAEEESGFAQLAKQHWLKPSKKATKIKVKNDVLKQNIWDPLEKEKFPIASLLALEGLQILENYLWPGYSEQASNHHVLLIVLIVNAKRKERLETWSKFICGFGKAYGLLTRYHRHFRGPTR